MDVKKIVLAYSGGLDTSVILKWLAEEYESAVIAYSADIGQEEDWDAVTAKGMATGAEKVVISDLKKEFVEDYIFPAFRANAIYEGSYLLGYISCPAINRQGTGTHCRGRRRRCAQPWSYRKGQRSGSIRAGLYRLNPKLKIIAPWRIWDLNSRTKLVEFAEKRNIPIPVTKKKPYSSDENLLHISFEGGILEDPWREPDEEMFTLRVSPESSTR